MVKQIINNKSKKTLELAITEMVGIEKVQSVIVCISENYTFDTNTFSKYLQTIEKTVVGGVFPEVIMNGERSDNSAIILGLSFPIDYTIVKEFDEEAIIENVSNNLSADIDENSTFLIFVDALVRQKTALFDCLYNFYGSIPNYLGGGAGTLKFEPTPCVISNDGIMHSVALISTIAKKINIGIAHGWTPISRQLKVTEVSNNEIISLDWQPVMEVYQKIVEEHSQKPFDYNDFFNCVKSYPIGIKKLNDHMTVRDPFKTENGRLFLLDNIEEGSYVQVLYGNLETLIDGAIEARKKAENEGVKDGNTILIDCISRSLFMGDDFDKELKQLDPLLNSFGALTLGEIANNGDEYLDVYNKTAVVGIFE